MCRCALFLIPLTSVSMISHAEDACDDPSISRRERDFFEAAIRIILISIADVNKTRLGYDEVSSSRASAIPLISLMSGVNNRALNPLMIIRLFEKSVEWHREV